MIEVRGVHPVEAREPVHLLDVAVSGDFEDVDWGSITQEDPSMTRDNWQVVYNEQENGVFPDGRVRAVFFFHYLDLSRPLETAYGQVDLPTATPLPRELSGVEYLEP